MQQGFTCMPALLLELGRPVHFLWLTRRPTIPPPTLHAVGRESSECGASGLGGPSTGGRAVCASTGHAVLLDMAQPCTRTLPSAGRRAAVQALATYLGCPTREATLAALEDLCRLRLVDHSGVQDMFCKHCSTRDAVRYYIVVSGCSAQGTFGTAASARAPAYMLQATLQPHCPQKLPPHAAPLPTGAGAGLLL